MHDQLDTRSCDSSDSRKAPPGGQDASMLAMLTTKLHEAAAQTQKVKAELKKLKQVIVKVKVVGQTIRIGGSGVVRKGEMEHLSHDWSCDLICFFTTQYVT